jgi:hypothetical protein
MISDISSNLIFKYSQKNIQGKWTFNGHILNVLYELDGKSTLSEISQKLKLNDNVIKKIITYLYKLKLIEPVNSEDKNKNEPLNPNFFDFLYDEFTNVVGPVAALIIDEALDDMGLDKVYFPQNRVPELIENLTIDCADSPEKVHFIKVMMKKIMN